MTDVYVRELLNEKVRGNFKISITKIKHIYLGEVKYLVTIKAIDNTSTIPRYSKSYKTLGTAKRKYNSL